MAIDFDVELDTRDALDMNDEYVRVAYAVIVNRVVEAFVRKFSVMPTFGSEEIDEWFRTYPIARKHAILERSVQTERQGAGYVFYRSAGDPKRPIVKVASNLAYIREDDDYEVSEAIVNVANTYISQFPNYFIVSHWVLKRAVSDDTVRDPKDAKEGKDKPKDTVQVTYEVRKEGAEGNANLDPAKAEDRATIDLINREVQRMYGVQLYVPMDERGFERIPLVLFKNEYQGRIILDLISPIVKQCANALRETDANLKATGPFWLLVGRSASQNNPDGLSSKLGRQISTHTGDDGERVRFAVIDQKNATTRYETLNDSIANLSTNPQFEQYIKLIEFWTEKAMKSVMAPAGTEGHQGVKNQTTSEVGASNQNTDDTISLYKRMRTYEWYRFAEMWFMTAGIPFPEGLEATLEDLKTQNEMIQEQKTDQENDFTKGEGKEKLQKAEDGNEGK